MNTWILYAAMVFYLLSTVLYWVEFTRNKPVPGKTAHYALILAFCVHLFSVATRYFEAGYTPITNLHESLSFFALCLAGFFLYVRQVYKVRAVGIIILPLVIVILGGAFANPAQIQPLQPALKSWWLPVHTIFAFSGNAIFLTAFLVSILYLIVERQIKLKKRLPLSGRVPSLEALDRINYVCMSYGFPFLTVAIVTGSIWAGFAWGSYWSWDPKETWSLITWIIYAIIIHNRHNMGWRGRKTAYMMIAGFVFVLFTFLGVNFLIKGLHSYV